jgi:malonate decarboxylase gamma subunit
VRAALTEALHDIQADPQRDLRQRLHGEHRQATRQVRALLQQQWTQNGG